MTFRKVLVAAAGVAALSMVAGMTHANTVNATLSAQYFEVAGNSGDPDFNVFSTPNVAAGSHLGPNGMPVATAPFGVNDINSGADEITWWDPALNSNVASTGTGTISLPFSQTEFPPNGTGTGDGTDFETAIFSGSFTLSAPSTVEFQLGSDDDSFIYVDGVLIGQNPGVHAVTNVDFTSGTLGAGPHTIEVFYDDRHQVAASLSLNLLSSGVIITPGVPEPATWSLMLVGIGALGGALRLSRRRQSALAAA